MLTSSNGDPVFMKNGFFKWKNGMEKRKHFKRANRLIRIWQKEGFLSDLKTHIARFPDGESLRQLAHG